MCSFVRDEPGRWPWPCGREEHREDRACMMGPPVAMAQGPSGTHGGGVAVVPT